MVHLTLEITQAGLSYFSQRLASGLVRKFVAGDAGEPDVAVGVLRATPSRAQAHALTVVRAVTAEALRRELAGAPIL